MESKNQEFKIEMPLEQMFEVFFGKSLLTTKQFEMEEEYSSLYDYLGKAAGTKLGKQVFEFAKKNQIKIKNKHVNQGGYVGLVMTYPNSFLFEFFKRKNQWKDVLMQWGENKQYFE